MPIYIPPGLAFPLDMLEKELAYAWKYSSRVFPFIQGTIMLMQSRTSLILARQIILFQPADLLHGRINIFVTSLIMDLENYIHTQVLGDIYKSVLHVNYHSSKENVRIPLLPTIESQGNGILSRPTINH
ncbi:uncharacterized protein LOC105167349 isoform X2 [Sesamum indicum]|nr:uncharacterized protein LOC105167349 isoform X2 [Sesamum indicum]